VDDRAKTPYRKFSIWRELSSTLKPVGPREKDSRETNLKQGSATKMISKKTTGSRERKSPVIEYVRVSYTSINGWGTINFNRLVAIFSHRP